MSLRDQICAATDELDALRRAYFQQSGITYDQMTDAARKVLLLRQEAEKQFKGRTTIKINAVSIARLIRSS